MAENSELRLSWRMGMLLQGSCPLSEIVAIRDDGKVLGRIEPEVLIYPDKKGDETLVNDQDAYPAYKSLSEIKDIFKQAGLALIPMMNEGCEVLLVNEQYQKTVLDELTPVD